VILVFSVGPVDVQIVLDISGSMLNGWNCDSPGCASKPNRRIDGTLPALRSFVSGLYANNDEGSDLLLVPGGRRPAAQRIRRRRHPVRRQHRRYRAPDDQRHKRELCVQRGRARNYTLALRHMNVVGGDAASHNYDFMYINASQTGPIPIYIDPALPGNLQPDNVMLRINTTEASQICPAP
jgi:hypothetical protein